MAEPKSVRPVMLPPPSFTEQAVERGLAEVLAAENLRDVAFEDYPLNDVIPPRPRKRRDSGIISGVHIDDTPTLPFIRVAHAEE